MQQNRLGLDRPRIIMAVTHCLAVVCGRMLHLTDGHLPSSEAGAGPLIKGHTVLVNLLLAVLSAGRERVLVAVRSVTAVHETTHQEAHINKEK